MAVELRGYPLRKLGLSDGTGEWKFSRTKVREKGREEVKEERWREEEGEEGRRKEGKKKRS